MSSSEYWFSSAIVATMALCSGPCLPTRCRRWPHPPTGTTGKRSRCGSHPTAPRSCRRDRRAASARFRRDRWRRSGRRRRRHPSCLRCPCRPSDPQAQQDPARRTRRTRLAVLPADRPLEVGRGERLVLDVLAGQRVVADVGPGDRVVLDVLARDERGGLGGPPCGHEQRRRGEANGHLRQIDALHYVSFGSIGEQPEGCRSEIRAAARVSSKEKPLFCRQRYVGASALSRRPAGADGRGPS